MNQYSEYNLFFNKALPLDAYRNISLYSFEKEISSLKRDFTRLDRDEGFYFNWMDNHGFILFDAFILEYEEILFWFNSTSKNSNGLISFYSSEEFKAPNRIGLDELIIIPLSTLKIQKENLGDFYELTIGDDRWVFNKLKSFANTETGNNLIQQIVQLNKISKSDDNEKANWKKDKEEEFQKRFLESLSGEELIRFASAHLFALAKTKTIFYLPKTEWELNLSEQQIEDLEEKFSKAGVCGPFLPYLDDHKALQEGKITGNFVDSKVILIWNSIVKKLNLEYNRLLSLNREINFEDIDRIYNSIIKEMEKEIKRYKKLLRDKISGLDSISQLPQRCDVYMWTSFYAIRKQFYEGYGDDPLLEKIEDKLNDSEEYFEEREKENKKLEELLQQVELVREDTLDLRANIMDVFESVDRIKGNSADKESIDQIIDRISNDLSLKLKNINTEQYIAEIKSWFNNWENLESDSKDFLLNGVLIKHYSNQLNDKVDFSGFVVSFSKCLEEELYSKFFKPFTLKLLNKYDQRDLIKLDLENLSDRKKKDYEKTLDAVNILVKQGNRITLGAMRILLSLLMSPKPSERVERISFLKLLRAELNESTILSSELIADLDILTKYRNEAAHPSKVSREDALIFEKKFKNWINDFFQYVSDLK